MVAWTLVCANVTKCCFIDRFTGKCRYKSTDELSELIDKRWNELGDSVCNSDSSDDDTSSSSSTEDEPICYCILKGENSSYSFVAGGRLYCSAEVVFEYRSKAAFITTVMNCFE